MIALRVARRWGPARIAYHLGMHPSTVHKILTRYGCLRLSFTDPATGAPVRRGRAQVRRYEHEAPGDLVHVDVKKLGRIPDGGGHKVHGRAQGKKNAGSTRPGYWYIHNAVDDHSRLAYSELLPDERKETAAGFWERANAYFAAAGIIVKQVLTDIQSRWATFRAFVSTGGEDRGRPAPARQRCLTDWSAVRLLAC